MVLELAALRIFNSSCSWESDSQSLMQLFRLQAREEKRRILYIKLQNFQHLHGVWQVQRETILIFPLGGQIVVFSLITIAASVLCQVLPGALCSLRGQWADGVSDMCFLREGWCGKRACCGWRACHFLNGTQIIAGFLVCTPPSADRDPQRITLRFKNQFSRCCDATGEPYFDRLLKAHFKAQNLLFCNYSREGIYMPVCWSCSVTHCSPEQTDTHRTA